MSFVKLEKELAKYKGNRTAQINCQSDQNLMKIDKKVEVLSKNQNQSLRLKRYASQYEQNNKEMEQGEPKIPKRIANKEKLLQTLQRHTELKKKYEQLIQSKIENRINSSNSIEQQPSEDRIKMLAYNEISEEEYAHKPLKENNSAPAFQSSSRSEKGQSPSFVSIFNGICLQQFQVVKFFNQGISGKVYLAQNIKTQTLFSIKMIKKQSLTLLNFNQLIREIKIQSYLNHPNVVKLYHTFVDKQYIYLFLQPCLDGDLFKSPKKNQGKFMQKETRQVIKQVCNAVEYMHKNDIIHRDLKPENILMHEGVVKICDFGWAVHSPLLRDTRCGTPVYASPEMIKRELYDSKIDIWNIGVLTYELLFGIIPFQIKQVDDINKIADQQIYFSQEMNVSESAKAFILGCLNKNPYKRYSIRQAIEHDFLKGSQKYRMSMA